MTTTTLVNALTTFVQRATGKVPTPKMIERAGYLIKDALEVVNPDDGIDTRLARTLAVTFELTAEAAGDVHRRMKPSTAKRRGR